MTEPLQEEIKKIARIGLFLKDYGVIFTIGVKFAAFIVWSATTYHHYTGLVDDLVSSNKELARANTAQAQQINAINKRYARLTEMMKTEIK